jgi:hypothetical protein
MYPIVLFNLLLLVWVCLMVFSLSKGVYKYPTAVIAMVFFTGLILWFSAFGLGTKIHTLSNLF